MQSAFRLDLLAGKKVFVTGGGTSMGKEIVLTYMQHGADAAIMGRRREKLEVAKAELEAKTGRRCHVCQGDVRDVEQVKAAVEAAVTALGQIDVLVNGAAGNYFAALDKLSYRAYKTVIEINLQGTFNVTKTVYERTMKHTGGSIINITATLHYTGTMGQAHSASGKAGVDALTRVLANELGPKRIRVNVIAPGFIADTVGIRKLQLEQKQQAYSDLIPLGRYGTKFDIGQAALYLYGADYVTGHCLVVDGGQWLISNQLVTFDEDYKKLWRAGRL